MTHPVVLPSGRFDEDRTRVAPRRRTGFRPPIPAGRAPPTRRRIRPVPPAPQFDGSSQVDPDDWDRRADRLQWWMSDLGGPYPVSVETTHSRAEASRMLEHGLRRLGVDVIEANRSMIKGLFPAPPEPALVRFARWLARRRRLRMEVVEVRLERAGTQCRVSARAGGDRSAEALRVALSELSPAPRPTPTPTPTSAE